MHPPNTTKKDNKDNKDTQIEITDNLNHTFP